MKYKVFLPILGLTFLAACASKEPTSEERIQTVGQSFTDTDKQLSETEKELTLFEKSVVKLRTSANKEPNMRTKAEFDEALTRLGNRIKETRLDLQDLKTANNLARGTYSEQMNEAASKMERSAGEQNAE